MKSLKDYGDEFQGKASDKKRLAVTLVIAVISLGIVLLTRI